MSYQTRKAEIKELDEQFAVELCKKLSDDLDLVINLEQCTYLTNYTNGNPFYITSIIVALKKEQEKNCPSMDWTRVF